MAAAAAAAPPPAVPDRDGANAPARAALREILIAATAAGGGPAARDAQAKLQREKPSC